MTDRTLSSKDESKHGSLFRFLVGFLFGVLLPAAVLGAGAYGAVRLMNTAPRAERNGKVERVQEGRLIEARRLERKDRQVVISAMGTVTPARRVSVMPRVGGEIVEVADDLIPGGYFREGETMVKIDPTDYEIALRQRETDVKRARSDYEIEMGQQQVAREEYELLGEEIPEGEQSLVLRVPQLAKARADLEATEAVLEDAKLDLARTDVKAPFNSTVMSENAEVGAIASTSTTIAQLVGSDRYWVELTVPVDELRWIELPEPDGEQGSPVHVFDEAAWGAGEYRVGRVLRLAPNVDEESRMARLIVVVEDPLALEPANDGEPRLLLNSYVRAEIQGRHVQDVIPVAREHLHEDSTVWVMNEEDRLNIRDVEIAWRGRDEVFISAGLGEGERLVTSNLSTPVEGMLLRTSSAGGSPASLEQRQAGQ